MLARVQFFYVSESKGWQVARGGRGQLMVRESLEGRGQDAYIVLASGGVTGGIKRTSRGFSA